MTKKAAELAILCDCRIGLIALVKDERSSEGKVFKHSTVDMEEIILEYLNHDGEVMEEIFSQIDMARMTGFYLFTALIFGRFLGWLVGLPIGDHFERGSF